VLFLSGMILMAYNMFKTIGSGRAVDDAKVLEPAHAH
jgi:cbb3-type cytochrome oxidase subunit 1